VAPNVKIAITGGIACGKSAAARHFRVAGVPICEADELGHAVLEEDDTVRQAIVARFGAEVCDESGSIMRARLAEQVFADAARRCELNRIMHPVIRERWQAWLDGVDADVAGVVIPLLYEAGFDAGWDAVVCVAASEDRQRAWLAGRGVDACGIDGRLAAQAPSEQKVVRADFVIVNNWSDDVLGEQVRRVLRRIVER
jgi:dephospho-CoA kinase